MRFGLFVAASLLIAAAAGGAEPAAVSSRLALVDPNADGPIPSPEPDWPQWNGRRRTGVCDEDALLPKWPDDGPPLKWKLTKLGLGWSSPIVVGGRLFITGEVGEDLVIYAFDLDGKPLWQVKNGAAWSGSYPGARACCAYSAGKLYHINAQGRVVCLEAATGKELWAVDVLARFQGENIKWAISECLLVDGPRLIVTPGGKKALMAALDKNDGQTVWASDPLPEDNTSYCPPLLFRHDGKRLLASCSSTHGFAVDADTGKLLWTVPLRSPYGVNVATPVYSAGQMLFLTPYVLGTCYRLPPGGAATTPEQVWTTTLDTCTGSLLMLDGRLYGSGYRKHKSWVCIDWASGEVRHEFKGLTTSAAVYADGRLYCLAEDGHAALLKPTAEEFRLDGRFKLVTEKVRDAWTHPIVLHGRLYLRYHDTLWCFDVKSR